MRRFLAATRYIALVPVVCIFVTATALMVYGAAETIQVIVHAFASEVSSKGVKRFLLSAIELVDLFLLATVLYVIAVGLYELFVDDSIPMPSWLVIHNLDDLKEKLIGVVSWCWASSSSAKSSPGMVSATCSAPVARLRW